MKKRWGKKKKKKFINLYFNFFFQHNHFHLSLGSRSTLNIRKSMGDFIPLKGVSVFYLICIHLVEQSFIFILFFFSPNLNFTFFFFFW